MTMMPLGEDFYRGRVAAVQAALAHTDADGVLLLNAPDIVYTAGFVHSPSERPIGLYVPTAGDPVLFIPLLEQENADATWIADVRTYFEYPGETDALMWMADEIGAETLLIESENIGWQRAGVSASPADIVKELRYVKTAEELDCTRQAAQYADLCLEHVRDLTPGIVRDDGTEIDILEAALGATIKQMRADLGGKYARRLLNVVGTVHSGPRGALPHGETSPRQPKPGDTLIAGIGASVAGYHAESGATFVIGQATPEQMRILQACVDCDTAAQNALTIGATCESVNEAALAELHNADLSAAIRHRIGHGMGLQGHEAPWLAPGDSTKIAENMVFSSEPGVYRPGVDGYRTINTFIVTPDGIEVPSRFLAENPPQARVLAL